MAVPNVTTDDTKHDIIRRFNENVRGKQAETTNSNQRHDGREGHWLERQMGLTANANNAPDLHGYEMKNQTTAKTTFGDWSADYYIYKDVDFGITRNQFLMIFGKPNSAKGGRYSWSGEPCPKINRFNSFGQKLYIDANHNIIVEYSFAHDERPDKTAIVPLALRKTVDIANAILLAKNWKESLTNVVGLNALKIKIMYILQLFLATQLASSDGLRWLKQVKYFLTVACTKPMPETTRYGVQQTLFGTA